MLRIPLISVLLGSASSITVDSPLGNALFRKARNLESSYQWMTDYSIKFTTCHTIPEYGIDENGDGYLYKQKLAEFKLCSTDKCSSTCNGGDYLVPLDDAVESYAKQMIIDRAYSCTQVKYDCGCENNEEDEQDGEDEQDEGQCEENCYLNAGMDYCIEQDSEDGGDNVSQSVMCYMLAMLWNLCIRNSDHINCTKSLTCLLGSHRLSGKLRSRLR